MTFRDFSEHLRIHIGGVGQQTITVFLWSEIDADIPPHHFDSISGVIQRYGNHLIDEDGGCCYVYPDEVVFWLQ